MGRASYERSHETTERGRLSTWRNPIYAIIRSGGRQYKVEPNQTFDVERLEADVGSRVDLGVLLLGGNGETQVGVPLVDGARVVAEVVEHGRGRKIIVFKYKNKTRYRRKRGHRQEFTRLSVKEIVTAGGTYTEGTEKPKPTRRSQRSLAEPEAEATVAAEVEAVETTAVEAAPEVEAPEAAAAAEAPETVAKPKRASARKPAAKRPAAKASMADPDAPKPAPRKRAAKHKAKPEAETSADAAPSEGE